MLSSKKEKEKKKEKWKITFLTANELKIYINIITI